VASLELREDNSVNEDEDDEVGQLEGKLLWSCVCLSQTVKRIVKQ